MLVTSLTSRPGSNSMPGSLTTVTRRAWCSSESLTSTGAWCEQERSVLPDQAGALIQHLTRPRPAPPPQRDRRPVEVRPPSLDLADPRCRVRRGTDPRHLRVPTVEALAVLWTITFAGTYRL